MEFKNKEEQFKYDPDVKAFNYTKSDDAKKIATDINTLLKKLDEQDKNNKK